VERGADGFRLDVPNEVPSWFWNQFRKTVREANPEVYIVGELWGDATSWLGPEMFDAVMNYKYFRDPVLKFLVEGKGDAATFDRELRPGRVIYPVQAAEAMMNLVGSHDTDRVRSVGRGDARRPMLAATFAMTYPGAPHIYYGDEIGMESANKDPDSRRPFVWDWSGNPERAAVHSHYKRVIALRREHEALRRGSFRTLLAEGQVFAYQRAGGGERFVVAMNAGESDADVTVSPDPRPADGATFRNMLSGGVVKAQGGGITVRVGGVDGVVLLEEKGDSSDAGTR
jgi:glycosidase